MQKRTKNPQESPATTAKRSGNKCGHEKTRDAEQVYSFSQCINWYPDVFNPARDLILVYYSG